MESIFRNIPVLGNLGRSKNGQNPVITSVPETTSIEIVSTEPEAIVREDCVLFPFSDKVSLFFQSMGAEIIEKMQHRISGEDFILWKLPDNITAGSVRNARAQEFTGTQVGPLAFMLFTDDNRLLAYSSGFRGKMVTGIGKTWDDIATKINDYKHVVPLPPEMVDIDGETIEKTLLNRYTEQFISGCTLSGYIDTRQRASNEFEAHRRLLEGTDSEPGQTFETFLCSCEAEADAISTRREGILNNLILGTDIPTAVAPAPASAAAPSALSF